MPVRSGKEAGQRIYAVAAAQSGLFTVKQAQFAGFGHQQPHISRAEGKLGTRVPGNLPADGLSGGAATGVVAVAFVVHGPGGVGGGGLQPFYRFRALSYAREEASDSAHDGVTGGKR
jgi:hypothetical protein